MGKRCEMQHGTSGASQTLVQFLGFVGLWVRGGTRIYPCAKEEPPFLALFPVLEGSFYIPGHHAHPAEGALSLLCLQNSWKDYQT